MRLSNLKTGGQLFACSDNNRNAHIPFPPQHILDLQSRLDRAEGALCLAEQAAATAASECAELERSVRLVADGEARSRRDMAVRAFELRDGLRQSENRQRGMAEQARRHKLQVSVPSGELHSCGGL